MATEAPITGAPSRASIFPNLAPLDDISATLESATGAVGVLSRFLGDSVEIGTDAVRAADAVVFILESVRDQVATIHQTLIDYRQADRITSDGAGLQHPAAAEGRVAYGLIYQDSAAPAGIAARLRERGGRLMVADDPRVREVGIFLHGLAEADEAHRANGGR